MSTQAQSLRLMLDFNYSTIQAGRIVRSIGYSAANMSVCADANFTVHEFIINFIKVNYNISTMVAFCPYTSYAIASVVSMM